MTLRQRLARRLRFLADRIDPAGAPRGTQRAHTEADSGDSRPPSTRLLLPLSNGGNWEGGYRDADGTERVHVPWQGWQSRPTQPSRPFLAPPSRREKP